MSAVFIIVYAMVLVLADAQGTLPPCNLPPPNTTVIPKRYHRVIPLPSLNWTWFDGISPSLPSNITVTIPTSPRTLTLTLQGRGSQDPENMDPFGSGMRVSSQFAYMAGKICARVNVSQTYGGTIWGLYIIDSHPPGNARNATVWREADYEWLGRPDHVGEVDITAWPYGLDLYSSQRASLGLLGANTTVQTPVRYCITWDFRPADAGSKFVNWDAALPGRAPVTLRRWSPPDNTSAAIYSTPVRVLFTVWSTAHNIPWAGTYNMPAGSQMKVTFSGITFYPLGPAYCPANDGDLQPVNVTSAVPAGR